MILKNRIFPELSHVNPPIDGITVFNTVNGTLGAACLLPVADLESTEVAATIATLESLIKGIETDWTIRMITSWHQGDPIAVETFRTAAINRIGHSQKKILLSIEKQKQETLFNLNFWKKTGPETEIRDFVAKMPKAALSALGAVFLTDEETRGLFLLPSSEISIKNSLVDFGTHVCGIIRLWKQGTTPMDEESLFSLLLGLPQPFKVSVSMKKRNRVKTELLLRSKVSQLSASTDVVSHAKYQDSANALQDSSLLGTEYCDTEVILLFPRYDERTLRQDLERSLAILRVLGDVMIETAGALNSLISTLPGSQQHFTFIERDDICPLYFPIFSAGQSHQDMNSIEVKNRSLLVHRTDGSIYDFDLFSKNFLAFNGIISGKSGSGKSVFSNLLSSSLLNDPDIIMMKIDVGGSYKKECEFYGGREVTFALDRPSGINPFAALGEVSASNEAVSVLTEFICSLVKEDGEATVPKSVKAEIENQLKAYSTEITNDILPNIDHFISKRGDMPRITLLKRWASGGVFENALKTDNSEDKSDIRYWYFNFENIQSASNRDFSDGVMSAVITNVNLEMLKISSKNSKNYGKRMVLICDETKFFIDRNADFFLLTTANFRKFGHGVILMGQNVQNFEIIRDGRSDSGIIINSPIRVFFPADADEAYLKDRFNLNQNQINTIIRSPHRGSDYREAVLQDDLGTRIIRLYLTREEYWRVSTNKNDIDRYQEIKESCPSLSVEEIIQCLILTAEK